MGALFATVSLKMTSILIHAIKAQDQIASSFYKLLVDLAAEFRDGIVDDLVSLLIIKVILN